MKNNDFGNLIRTYRLKKGWTQLQLAQALGFEIAQFVSLIECNNSKCPLKVLGQMIVLLNIPEKAIIDSMKKTYVESLIEEIEVGKKIALLNKKEKKAK